MEYFLQALRNYAVFSGRARRKEYWMFVLFNFLFSLVAGVADYVLTGAGSGAISGLYALAVLIPSLAVGVSRLHDVGKSGWFTLIILVPLVGVIWLLVLDCTEGTRGDNEYGPDPKGGVLAF
jgi:uncharacterized membrane protein YhaH (DUF805 family)